MQVNDITGDLFEGLSKGDVIAHGCNCFGVMGAGVAKAVRDKFPKNFDRYKGLCDDRTFRPGGLMYFNENGIGIYNLGTQWKPGADAHIVNVRESVKEMVRFAAFRDQWTIRTVRLGCGIGGLDWADVKPVLEEINSPVTLDVYFK